MLKGSSKEGKSRTLFEAVGRMPQRPLIAIPQTREVTTLIELLEPTPGPVVVWLDQIDRYLRGDFPTDHLRSGAVWLVGTIEDDRWSEIMHGDHRPNDELYVAREALRYALHRTATARLALIRRRLKDERGAETLFREAIAAGSLIARNNYGYMRPDAAEEVLAPAVAAGNRTAAFNLLEALSRQHALERADERFTPGVEAGNVAAALNLGMVVHGRGDLDAAERLYRAAEKGTRSIDARFGTHARIMRAIIAAQRGDEAEALSLWDGSYSAREWEEIQIRLVQARLEDVREIAEGLRCHTRSSTA